MANIKIIQGGFEQKLMLQFAPGIKAGFPSPAGANAFKSDLPNAEIHFVPSGHFALESHHTEIARLMKELSDEEGQQRLMKQLLGQTKGAFTIVAPFWCDYGYNISVGENFFANHNTVILDGARVTFGDNVFVAPNCGFYTAGHPIDAERRNQGLEYAYPITIGDNVWIGAGVYVMPGVTIGSNVIIGGGSVVEKDIPDNSVAVGNPCKLIRAITEEDKKNTWSFMKRNK